VDSCSTEVSSRSPTNTTSGHFAVKRSGNERETRGFSQFRACGLIMAMTFAIQANDKSYKGRSCSQPESRCAARSLTCLFTAHLRMAYSTDGCFAPNSFSVIKPKNAGSNIWLMYFSLPGEFTENSVKDRVAFPRCETRFTCLRGARIERDSSRSRQLRGRHVHHRRNREPSLHPLECRVLRSIASR